MTLTFKDREISAEEAQKRFHSLWSNLFSERVGGAYFCVLQYQRVRWWVGEHYGTPHYHLIIVWPGIRKGSRYHLETGAWTVGPELARLEALFMAKHERYGFGPQHRFEPLRNDYPVRAGVAYIVRYLQSGIEDAVARPVWRWGIRRRRRRNVYGWWKMTPRSYRFGRGVVRIGRSETFLRWGRKKRDMIRCYCEEHGLSFDEFEYEVDVLYPDRSLRVAIRLLWRERIVPLWKLRQVEPF